MTNAMDRRNKTVILTIKVQAILKLKPSFAQADNSEPDKKKYKNLISHI